MKKKQKREECKTKPMDREDMLSYIREILEGIHYIGMRKDFYGKHACLNTLVMEVITCIDELEPKKEQVFATHHREKQSISFEEFLRQNLCKKD
ncbi:hypothetical protein [Helicobacter typhlonius]|uniref:hypothetical protein n=1 Tax=Helicobacter typhlonius TaxID=76936 RepID=UPI00261C3C57|nr:hypothetical protein [uncultured Helicobacter sp.]